MSQEQDELNQLMANAPAAVNEFRKIRGNPNQCGEHPALPRAEKTEPKLGGLIQWTTGDGKRFIPASHTSKRITPGAYEIQHSQTIGIYFERLPIITDDLIRFPQTNSEKVVLEIQKFWERKEIFQEYNLTHKRGIILWGPPGSGKSCTIQLILQDVVEREGVVIRFGPPTLFSEGMRIFREIEPDTPVVILIEDIDSILQDYNQSEVLNILDGINQIQHAVFLATTNYPELLGPRILNRPSRFDKRFKIGHPNEESRALYFRHIIGGDEKIKRLGIDLDRWVKDTRDFSIAHLKELFVAVTILGDDYGDAIETLTKMKEERISSNHDEDSNFGFHKASMGFRR